MSFKVAARTILQLGAELVSSDAVAFYELIKNAFDANSPHVTIKVDVALSWQDYALLHDQIVRALEMRATNINLREFRSIKHAIEDKIIANAATADTLVLATRAATTWQELLIAVESASCVSIIDNGDGMSCEDLNDCFLTIGTRSRQSIRDKRANDEHPILGEKGLGRLSAMRLGQTLHVQTSKAHQKHWNILDIDWRLFDHNSDALVGDIDIEPLVGPKKESANASGTTLTICALTFDWSQGKLEEIVKQQFGRLTDPFTPSSKYPIKVFFNGSRLPIPSLNRLLFDAAHASGKAQLDFHDDIPVFSGEVKYLLHHRTSSFRLEGAHLLSESKAISMSVLKRLGPFTVQFYWFNRKLLSALDGIGTQKEIKDLQKQWSGGLMLFRDGFRVHPYGDPEDDWLKLDRKALASSGYKVNRAQLIGKVDITSRGNAALLDKTSREGLLDCVEKSALTNLLVHLLEVQFRRFLNSVDAEIESTEPLDASAIKSRVATEVGNMRDALQELKNKYPRIVSEDRKLLRSVENSIERLGNLMVLAEQEVDSYKQGRSELVHLASMGLLVEIVVHELSRSTEHTLTILSQTDESALTSSQKSAFKTLGYQLKTIQKRLSLIDPASVSRRQDKERFDLVFLVREILSSHSAQFDRHKIKCDVDVLPSTLKSWNVKMVKGMFVHVLENLLSNAVYWLKQYKRIDESYVPRILFTLDRNKRCIVVSDNGPGIPDGTSELIFEAFYTTKPPGEGKGLGLFIAREIVRYHGASLTLSDPISVSYPGANFVIEFGEKDDD